MSNYFSIGKISAVFGLEGEVILKHSLGKRTFLKGVEVLFLEERKDSFIPYFLEKAKPKDHENVYVKLEGVNTPKRHVKYCSGVFTCRMLILKRKRPPRPLCRYWVLTSGMHMKARWE
ncbi:hypothetical protein MKQ70_31745 [Chitinophaga sedimenti]|uniref:hypothetical protein n=1 Tax=Chitinophaga sedimenti TaxID=2033606 RepID=UPI0020034831|nr:hypothetical protein [Chitinophaga sedimenti]MCK7559294.1 hypothetical protein [Chitinophaga sedimenti]